MPDVGGIAGTQLKSFIERIERLEDDKRALAAYRERQVPQLSGRRGGLRWLGDDAFGNARSRKRCDVDLLCRCDPRERLRRAVPRRIQGTAGLLRVREPLPERRFLA
jgi:hypothetical protein